MDLFCRLKRWRKKGILSPRRKKHSQPRMFYKKSRSEITYIPPDKSSTKSMSQSSASFDPLTNPNEDASQDVRDEYVDWPNRCEFLSEVELYRELSGLEQRKKSSVRIYNMYLNDDTAPQPLYISEDMHYRILQELENPSADLFDGTSFMNDSEQ
mmetsp:Transcript_29572/g.32939  ORF Transcript_29572/g.32939 Transcript_29572/m.32939 type:complete len:155 (-) Transcript_29572:277-741(-)